MLSVYESCRSHSLMDVSVIVPVYNRATVIADCLNTILGQETQFDFEVIVIDDGSTDATAARLAEFRDQIRVIRTPNQGPGAARNAGISVATASLICLMDSDDRMLPGKIEVQTAFMKSHEVDLTFGAVLRETAPATPYLSGLPIEDKWRFMTSPYQLLMTRDCECINTVTVMFRKAIFDASGGFNPDLRCGEDSELWLKIARHGRLAYIGRPFARIGESESNRMTKSPYVYLHGPTVMLNELASIPDLEPADLKKARRTCRRSVNMMLRYDWLNNDGDQLGLYETRLTKVFGRAYTTFWKLINLIPVSLGRFAVRLVRIITRREHH